MGSGRTATREEENKMESTICVFEKKRDMDELVDNPETAQSASLHDALAHNVSISGIPMCPIRSIEKGKPVPRKSVVSPHTNTDRLLHNTVLLPPTADTGVSQYVPESTQRRHLHRPLPDPVGHPTSPPRLPPQVGPKSLTKKTNMFKFVNLIQTYTH